MEYNRRLSNKIIAAHKMACDEKNNAIAALLLEALQIDQSSIGGEKKDHRESLALIEAAFELHDSSFG